MPSTGWGAAGTDHLALRLFLLPSWAGAPSPVLREKAKTNSSCWSRAGEARANPSLGQVTTALSMNGGEPVRLCLPQQSPLCPPGPGRGSGHAGLWREPGVLVEGSFRNQSSLPSPLGPASSTLFYRVNLSLKEGKRLRGQIDLQVAKTVLAWRISHSSSHERRSPEAPVAGGQQSQEH